MKSNHWFGVVAVVLLTAVSAFSQVPFVQSLNPVSIAPGSQTFTLTVTGAGFNSTSVVNWNGVPHLTEVLSVTQVRASINASDVAIGSTASVTVTNSPPMGGTSNVMFFPITVPESSIGMEFLTTSVSSFGGSVVAGDFNGDGKLDFVWTDDNSVFNVSLGNGNGTFRSPINSGVQFTGVATGDFNSDGKMDVVGWSNEGIGVMLGNGDGTFALKTTSGGLGGPYYSIAVGDFNRDGILDLFVAPSGNEDGFEIYLGKGDGTFSIGQTYGRDEISFGAAVGGDFNGDGKIDVVADGYTLSGGWLRYTFLGNGDGTFNQAFTSPGMGSAATGDMNGDGALDLVIDGLCVMLGNGTGSFTQGGCTQLDYVGLIGVGDFNGDGNLDAVSESGGLTIAPGDGKGDLLSPFLFCFL